MWIGVFICTDCGMRSNESSVYLNKNMFLDDVVMDKNIDCSGWGKTEFSKKCISNNVTKKMTISTRTKEGREKIEIERCREINKPS